MKRRAFLATVAGAGSLAGCLTGPEGNLHVENERRERVTVTVVVTPESEPETTVFRRKATLDGRGRWNELVVYDVADRSDDDISVTVETADGESATETGSPHYQFDFYVYPDRISASAGPGGP